MKRLIPLLLLVALVLSACAGEKTVMIEGKEHTFDYEACTVTDGQYIYTYSIDGHNITVTYPDGAQYWFRVPFVSVVVDGDIFVGGEFGSSEDYQPGRYTSGEPLIRAVWENVPEEKEINWFMVVITLLFAAVGVFCIIHPEDVWYMAHSMTVEGGEPTDYAIDRCRNGGILIVIVSAIYILQEFVGG